MQRESKTRSKYAASDADAAGEKKGGPRERPGGTKHYASVILERLDTRFAARAPEGRGGPSLEETASDAATTGDRVQRPSLFYPAQLYRRHSRHLDACELQQVNRLDDKFGLGSKRVDFNTRTFWEEFGSHMAGATIGPLSAPIVYMLSGYKGGLITAFLPGKISYEGEEPHSNLSIYFIQMFVWATHWVPIYTAMGYFMSGKLVTYFELTPWVTHKEFINGTNNETTNTISPPGAAENAVWTDITAMDMCVLPFMVVILRQYVIAVKYAFISRKRIREHRANGRNMERWLDERLNAFYYAPSREMMMLSLEKACWRAGIGDPEHIYFEFVDIVPASSLREMDLAETNEIRDFEQKKNKSEEDIEKLAASDTKMSYKDTHRVPLKMFLKLVTVSGCEEFSDLPSGKASPSANLLMMTAAIAAVIPPIFRVMHGRPAFGETHLDKWLAGTQSLNIFSPFGYMATVFLFPACLKIHFDRHRYFMHHYFELLIPSTVPDAREIDTFLPPSQMFAGLPDLKPSARNVYNWNLGRRALRKYALYFRRRMEFFLGVYIVLLFLMCVYEFMRMVLVVNSNGTIRVTTALILELYMAIMLIIGGLLIIRTGMRANRQTKLHKSAVEHYRTRLAGHVLDQTEVMETAGFDNVAIEARVGPVKKLQTALKHVSNELDAEADSEKLRVNGIPMDARMAEGLLGLLGSMAWVVYNVVIADRNM
jgi:hypothetical protein